MAESPATRGVEQLNSLLRGEISAVETYEQAIKKVGEDRVSDGTLLRAIAQEHGEHAQRLREEVRRLGGEPDNASGVWGVYAKTIEGVAKLFGDSSALKALKEGEEHGLKDYREALDDVDDSGRRLIAEVLIPAQQRHITTLDALMQRIEK